MSIKIALAGNPNSGKTTLFNLLTGSNQYVGNWPGVTVEKKEGKLKKQGDVIVTDLPGIYSLSPYTLEEVVAREYLVNERPDVILNIVDGTNLERNLYLTTQLIELGIPVVIAINMMDVVRKNGEKIDTEKLSKQLECKIVEISALKATGIDEAVQVAIEVAKMAKRGDSMQDILAWAEKEVDKFAVYFYADDLKFFQRSGRVSGIAATMGSLLGIKPIIHIDADGKMIIEK